MNGRTTRRRAAWALACGWLALACGAARAGQLAETAKLLPEDTLVVAAVENVKAMGETFKKTSLYALYKDPAMQRFIVPVEQKVREAFTEAVAKAGQELHMELPKDLPWPEGRIVAAFRLAAAVKQVPNMVFDEKEEKMVPQGTRNQVDVQPQFILWADMGANAAGAKDLVDKLVEKGAEHGAKRRTETVRGQEVFVVTGLEAKPKPAPAEREKVRKGDDSEDSTPAPTNARDAKEDALVYMFQGNVLVLGNSLDLFRETLARAGGESMPNLADDADMKAALAGAGGEGNVSIYFNVKPLLKLAADSAAGEAEKAKVAKTLATLGVDTVTGMAAAVTLAPGDKEDLRVKAFLRVKGPKRGIPAMLAGTNRSTQPEASLTAGLSAFVVANHDLGDIVDQALKMATQISGAPIEAFLQSSVSMTGGPEGNPPPVDLKADVIGQLTRPVILTSRAGADGGDEFLLSVALRNAATFDKAFGRIHTTYIAQGKDDARRELRKSTIYLLAQLRGLLGAVTGAGTDEQGAPKPEDTPAIAVVGNAVVVSRLGLVEQTIRNQGRADLPGIAADKMYQHAAAFLPAEASLWSYGNQQIAMESFWKQMKALAGDKGEVRRRASPQLTSLFRGLEAMTLGRLRFDQVDFSTLPDYADVKKHFGAQIGALKNTDDGLLLDAVYIKSPEAAAAKP